MSGLQRYEVAQCNGFWVVRYIKSGIIAYSAKRRCDAVRCFNMYYRYDERLTG